MPGITSVGLLYHFWLVSGRSGLSIHAACAKVAVARAERMKRKLEMEENDARFRGMVATLDAEPGYKEPAQDDGESHQPQSGEIETQHAIANC